MNSVDSSTRPSIFGRLPIGKGKKNKDKLDTPAKREARILLMQQRASEGVCIFTGKSHREAYGTVIEVPDDVD